jgi:NAD(P)-dependent dehydrogenase (short-subunit alcohol dehydrogenase family)
MAQPLQDRIALVTGASRGIGHATALALARRGAHVVAVARTTGGLEELDDAIRGEGGTATLVPLDMKDTPGIARLAEALEGRYQRLDVLVGNAGIVQISAPLAHIEPRIWDDVMAVNFTANWHLLRLFEPLLKRSDAGRAVFVTSGAGIHPGAYRSLYAASKAALDAMVRSYAAETASGNLKVNLFNPGRTRTQMHKAAFPGIDPMTIEPPENVAEKIVALCLPDCAESGQYYDYPSGAFLNVQAKPR